MKIISLNCNGLRSATEKGLLEFIEKISPEIVSLQEIKASESQLDLNLWEKNGYMPYIYSAEKKGYSGTAIFTKHKPVIMSYGLTHPLYDSEARSILVSYNEFTLINTYFPSGTSGEERQKIKMEFLDFYYQKVLDWKKKYQKLILCGDFNIAHTKIDIHDPIRNAKNSGFLPEERTWLDKLFESGFVDTYRCANPNKTDEYSWWTYRSGARKNNKGWRIDYFVVTENIKSWVITSKIFTDIVLSDHAPLLLELEIPLSAR
ncbi:MAG: exodeoxyribonuclease III [Leptospiraceae bacterium]|nr:exodeoxyribonuclease III [Leptospiraceae bacterium]MCP5498174.1 exodeoxyribonuclease III [Leptospiraceae bacterium]